MDNSRTYYGGGGDRDRGGDRHRPYRRGGRGRGGGGYHGGGGHRHQPYRGRGGGGQGGHGGGGQGGHGGGRGNRFASQQQTDPETTLFRQIASFVSRVGEFQKLQHASPNDDGSMPPLRAVEFTASSNINQLLPVLCDPKTMEGLLKYSPDATQPEDKVGKLVHLVVSCVSDLPLQTPCYAALTLAVHEQVKNSTHQGFAVRCLQYTMLQIAKELDVTLLASNPKPAKSTCRLKLLVRYLCIMAHMGLVATYDGETTVDPNHMTIFGFISVLVDAATAAADQFHNFATASWLALMVLSSVPYLIETQIIPSDVIENRIRKPLEQLITNYKSTFTPGTGITAVLLKEPQVEEEDDEDQDDAEDDEDEEEGEGPQLICDSLQDLLRATKYWRKEGQPAHFALPVDAPWKGLMVQSSSNPDSGEEMESRPIQYTDTPLYLAFPQECQLLNLLLSGAGSDSPLKLQFFSLEGAVFGRLPIFGSPPDPTTQHDDDDEEDMEDAVINNKQLEAFRGMSLLDRYFVAESIRDCLVSHEAHVNASGLQFGSAKSAAEELLLVYHVFSKTINEGEDPSQGIEYAILETLFSLLAQANDSSSLRHTYLSRVILELIRLEPSRISQALAIAMTNLFQDYLPALVPAARENFSRWFAFHLTNTDYQWPSAYWQLWEPYATSDKQSSRGTFVRRSLNLMAENLSDPIPIVKQSFGGVAQSLVKELLGRTLLPVEPTPDEAIEGEVHRRLWDNREDPTHLLEYMKSGQVGQALGSGGWPRTDVVLAVLLHPARQLHQMTMAALEKAVGDSRGSDNAMEDDTTFSKDAYVLVTGAIQQYTVTLLGVMEMDAESKGGDKETIRAQGGAYLLRRAESMLSFNASLLEGVLVTLLQNRIVEGISVFKWVLRDVGDSVIAPIVPSWYNYAALAIRESLLLVANEATAGGIMALDSGNATEDEFVSKMTLTPVGCLHYATRRVCSLLVTTQQNETKLKPIQVELVEGLKYLTFTTKKLVGTNLLRPPTIRNPLSASDIEVVISKSELSGASLAAICSVDETSAAVSLLKKSLEDQ